MHTSQSLCLLTMNDQVLELVAGRFRVLGEPYRLRLLQALKAGEMSVGELVKALNGNQPNISRHLQLLQREGLVLRRRDGSRIFYSIRELGTLTMLDLALKVLK